MRPPKTWVISDTHFFHNSICCKELEARPPDFNEQIIKNLRHLVARQDILVHLGDVIFYKYPSLKGILDSIPGKKVLTMGNHDKKTPSWYERNGFDFACDTFTHGDVLFSHHPIRDIPNWISTNVHGHLHANGRRPTGDWYHPGSTHRLFVLEHHYKPIDLQEFLSKSHTDHNNE